MKGTILPNHNDNVNKKKNMRGTRATPSNKTKQVSQSWATISTQNGQECHLQCSIH